MALLLPKSVFFHIPKTGGMWVHRAAQRAGLAKGESLCNYHYKEGIPSRFPCCTHNIPETNYKELLEGKFLFAFVRNPLTWYQSLWSYHIRVGWESGDTMYRKCASDKFDVFVRSVLQEYGGVSSARYKRCLGENAELLNVVGRFENITEDLIYALEMAGEEFDSEIIHSNGPTNHTSRLPYWKEKC